MLVTKAYGMLLLFNIFTALLYLCRTVLAMSEMSVRLSVRPSVKRVNCEKKRKKYMPKLLYTKIHSCSFLTSRMVGRGRLLLPKILEQTDPVGTKTPTFNRYSLVAPQPQFN